MEAMMPYPEIYTRVLFAAVLLFCTAAAAASVPFYNTLWRKELLSDSRPAKKAESPLFYIVCALFGLAVGTVLAFRDMTPADAAAVFMIPAAVTVAVCDILNGFVPVIGLVLVSLCAVARCVASCVAEGALWPALTFVFGAVFGILLMLLINFISKKTGAAASDTGHTALVTVICASAGIVPGTAVLALAVTAALLSYILPVHLKNRKNGGTERLSEINYPLAPFLFVFYYAGVLAGLF